MSDKWYAVVKQGAGYELDNPGKLLSTSFSSRGRYAVRQALPQHVIVHRNGDKPDEFLQGLEEKVNALPKNLSMEQLADRLQEEGYNVVRTMMPGQPTAPTPTVPGIWLPNRQGNYYLRR